MGLRQRRWALKAHRQLITTLGAKCAACGSTDNLEIDHVAGKDWTASKLELSARISRYRAEYAAGVQLQVLCKSCNSSKGDPRKTCYTPATDIPF